MQPRILIIDGYDAAGQASLKAGNATLAGELYKSMISRFVRSENITVIDLSMEFAPKIDLQKYDGVCWTGSNLFFSKSDDVVQRHIDLSRSLFAAKIPQFGSCWAAQLAAVAAGGEVRQNPKGREFGLARKIALTEAGLSHPMYQGKPQVTSGFTSHGDIVTKLPGGATLLAGNSFSPVQALAVNYKGGEFWAVQYHPEYDCAELAALTRVRQEALTQQGTFAHKDDVQAYCDKLEILNSDPHRQDIAWLLGFDEDVLDVDIRTLEVKNWLDYWFNISGNYKKLKKK